MTTRTNSGRPVAAPRRGRSKAVRRLVITLVVLLGLLVAADFGAAAVFEHEVSKRAQQQFDLRDHPSVKVGGFSFLAQAVSGEYDLVTVDAKGVPVNTLSDVEVHADLRGVQAPLSDLVGGSLKSVPVREVEGQVKVKAADVSRAIQANENEVVAALTNLTIDPASAKVVATAPVDGAETEDETAQTADAEGTTAGVRMCGTADIAAQSTELCVFSIISLVQGKIVIDPKRLELRNSASEAQLPAQLQSRVLPLFKITLDPGVLPFKVTPTAVTVEPGLLSVKGKATDVVLGG